MKQSEITNILRTNYPEDLASPFDQGKIGLQFGSNNKEIKKIMIALDGTLTTVTEATENNCDLLLTHHPFMFNPMLSLNYDSPFGQKIQKVINHKLNIYAMHTNFDVASCGMNEILAHKLGLENIKAEKDEIDQHCFIRTGFLKKPLILKDYVREVLTLLNEKGARVIGKQEKIIKKVGIVGGAGAGDLTTAIRLDCDVLITGEVKHNQALDAVDYGIAVIEVSHSIEALFKDVLCLKLQKLLPDVEIICSKKEQDPFVYYQI